VNGEAVDVAERASIRELLVRLGLAEAVCAVAVNRDFVPKGEHPARELHPDDEVDIVAPMQGG
jgi:sulfur carrier protein